MAPNAEGERIQQLFLEAARLSVEDRDDWLRAHCGGDDQLFDEVRSLLRYDDLPVDPLESGPSFCAGTSSPAGGYAESPIVPGYKIVREIGTGGQAIVYEAIQESTTQRVALKMLRWGPMASAQERERLRREVLILARLSHPGIVSIIDCGETTKGVFFIVTEIVDGERLNCLYESTASEAKLPSERDPGESRRPAAILPLFVKLCDAVDFAHQAGVIHRDLKPSNVLIDRHNEPRVLDFGLAKPSTHQQQDIVDADHMTQSGQFMGSLPWASPEQAEGGNVDARSDVYSLGIILYQLLSGGRFPYNVTGTMQDVLPQILHAKPTPLTQAVTDGRQPRGTPLDSPLVDDRLNAIVLRALAKSKDDRYATAGDFAHAVEQYVNDTLRKGFQEGNSDRLAPRRRLAAIGFAITVIALLLLFRQPISVVVNFGNLDSEPASSADTVDDELAANTTEPDSTTSDDDSVTTADSLWNSFGPELSKLADGESITKTGDRWRVRRREVILPEMKAAPLLVRAVLHRNSSQRFALRFRTPNDGQVGIEFSPNGSNTEFVDLVIRGMGFIDGRVEHTSSVKNEFELVVALLPDRISVACEGQLKMQLHCRVVGPWIPVFDAHATDVDVLAWEYQQPVTAPPEYLASVIAAEANAVQYVLDHGGGALSKPSSPSISDAPFQISSLTTDGVSESMSAQNVADVTRCKALRQLNLTRIADPVETMNRVAKLKGLKLLAVSHSQLEDDCFHFIAELDELETLSLYETQIRNPDFSPLKRLTALEHLSMTSVVVDDTDLDRLADIKGLRKIYADGSAVTSKGFRCLLRLQDLYIVELLSSQVSGDGMRYLSQLADLWQLNISGSDLRDEDVPFFSGMSNLRRLTVKNTRLTSAGVKALRLALPECTIVVDEGE